MQWALSAQHRPSRCCGWCSNVHAQSLPGFLHHSLSSTDICRSADINSALHAKLVMSEGNLSRWDLTSQNAIDWVSAYLTSQKEFWKPYEHKHFNKASQQYFLEAQQHVQILNKGTDSTSIVKNYTNNVGFLRFCRAAEHRFKQCLGLFSF